MGKNKFGKFIAFTTAVAAIGGTCYIFRDKIKNSEIYNKICDALTDRLGGDTDFDEFEDDDFDDTELFSEEAKRNREYTSINITGSSESKSDVSENDSENKPEEETPATEENTEIKQDEETPVLDDNSESEQEEASVPTENTESDTTDTPVSEKDDIVVNPSLTPSAFEYEGLSDVSEDPDSLEEQDKLDF